MAEDLPTSPSLQREFTRSSERVLTDLAARGADVAYWARVMTDQLVGPETHPALIPWETVYDLGFDSTQRLGETIAIAPALDPEGYYVRDRRPEIVAEVEAWLWPLLPKLLRMILRAVAWGAVPAVLTWARSTKQGVVRERGGAGTPLAFPDLLHYSRVDDVFPAEVEVILDRQGDLDVLRFRDQAYTRDRARLWVWEDEWGWLIGSGSRRRNFRPILTKRLARLLRGRYLERSVEPARIGWAPSGVQKDEAGNEFSPITLMTDLLLLLKSGGVAVFPNKRFGGTDQTGERMWDYDLLETPDREQVFEDALTYEDGQILLGCMVPPATVLSSGEGLAGARVPAEAYVELVEMAARFAAAALSELVAIAHYYNHGPDDPPPDVCTRQFPKAKRKLLLDVFGKIAGDVRQMANGRRYTLGSLVTEEILDMLGLPRRAPAEADELVSAGPTPPGRQAEATSAREDRREAGTTDDAEEATGAEGEREDDAPDEA